MHWTYFVFVDSHVIGLLRTWFLIKLCIASSTLAGFTCCKADGSTVESIALIKIAQALWFVWYDVLVLYFVDIYLVGNVYDTSESIIDEHKMIWPAHVALGKIRKILKGKKSSNQIISPSEHSIDYSYSLIDSLSCQFFIDPAILATSFPQNFKQLS